MIEFGRSLIEFGRSFIEFGRSFVEFGRSLIEFGRSFVEFGRSLIEFNQWLGWGKTQIIEQRRDLCVHRRWGRGMEVGFLEPSNSR
ncbi:MAG: hypothetical protein RM049_33505 [Nostoc sp. DedQUE04]|uniref:hypothetical protein n=1 Tax=Nostoc sp. DedQUE04 TaxID=3075390 RepID=UPI002AD42E4A|nr:hypothetical protein [Nostoc sp. DedQUE04]MDZ8140154.1 hypothetical protein [Nostoc sp. DedQUE04]